MSYDITVNTKGLEKEVETREELELIIRPNMDEPHILGVRLKHKNKYGGGERCILEINKKTGLVRARIGCSYDHTDSNYIKNILNRPAGGN